MFNRVFFFIIMTMLLSFTLANGQYLSDPERLPSPPYNQCVFSDSPEEIQIDKLISSLVVTNLQDCVRFVHDFQSSSNFLDLFSLHHSRWPALDNTSKHLLITEIELSPPIKLTNSSQWIEVYNPTNNTFFMPLEISVSDTKFLFSPTLFPSHQFKILNFSNANNPISNTNHIVNDGTVLLSLLPYPDHPLVLQRTFNQTRIGITPILSDSLSTSETWQINNKGDWIFMENTPLEPTKSNLVYGFIPINKSEQLPPLKQLQSGISSQHIQCDIELELIFKSSDGSPACVKPETAQKLIERGWARETSENILSSKSLETLTVEELLIQNQIAYLPDKLVVTGGPTIQGDPGCGAVIDMDSNTHWFSIDSISNPKNMTLYSENPGMCKANESSCFCNAQIELTALTLKELSYFTIEDQEKYSNILIDYLGKENINRTPKFVIGKLNLNYTDSSTIGYCGKMWGENDYGFFSGAIVNDKVMGYGVDKEPPLLCAISTDAKYFGKAFGENEN